MSDELKNKREAIRVSRETARLTQGELSRKVGISQSKLSLFEKGYVELTGPELHRVESALVAAIGEAPRITLKSLMVGSKGSEITDKSTVDLRARQKLRRKSAGMSQHELAKISGIYRTKLTEWENGSVELTEDEAAKLEKALLLAESRKLRTDPYFQLKVATEAGADIFKHAKEMQASRDAAVAERDAAVAEKEFMKAMWSKETILNNLRFQAERNALTGEERSKVDAEFRSLVEMMDLDPKLSVMAAKTATKIIERVARVAKGSKALPKKKKEKTND